MVVLILSQLRLLASTLQMRLVVDSLSLRRCVVTLSYLVGAFPFGCGPSAVTLRNWLSVDICEGVLLREPNLIMIWNSLLLVVEVLILMHPKVLAESLVFLLLNILIHCVLMWIVYEAWAFRVLPLKHLLVFVSNIVLMLHISVVLSEHGTPCLVPLELLTTARDLTQALVLVEILWFNLVTLHHRILRLSHLLLLVVILKPALVKIHLRLLGWVHGDLALHLLVLQSHGALHRIDLRHVV